MQLETYDICKGCGKSNVTGKMGLCFPCYVHRNDKEVLDLRKKIKFAEGWLEQNRGHKNFAEALKRYEVLIDRLNEIGD